MRNLNIDAVEQSAAKARQEPEALRQHVELKGEWQTGEGEPQFRATIPYPQGEVEFTADFPPPLGGSGEQPRPLLRTKLQRPRQQADRVLTWSEPQAPLQQADPLATEPGLLGQRLLGKTVGDANLPEERAKRRLRRGAHHSSFTTPPSPLRTAERETP